MINRLIELAIQIQQVPAPTFEEAARAEFIRQKFLEAQDVLKDIQIDAVGNVLARLPGSGQGKPLVISAHMDTVFPAETTLAVRRTASKLYGPGLGDNSLGVAGLFGVLWAARQRNQPLAGDIWLVANTCEEGLGDLRGMKALVERFGASPKAYLILEGLAFGHVYHRAIAVQRYKISVQTPGGHSWSDFGKPSAIHEISTLIAKISSISMPQAPHTTFNIGRVGGGTSINTIAAQAWMELDLRSETQIGLDELAHKVKYILAGVQKQQVEIVVDLIGQRPAGEISANNPLILLAQRCLREQGMEPVLTIGSTDANIPLSLGYPALVLGLTQGGSAHTVDEFIETNYLERGLAQLVRYVSQVWD